MKIEIDTDNLSPLDKRILSLLCEEVKAETTSTPLEEGNVKFPKIHGKTKETIQKILAHLETATYHEICMVTDIPESTVRCELCTLKKKGIISASFSRPKRYFLKTIGDKELAECLKNVKRRK